MVNDCGAMIFLPGFIKRNCEIENCIITIFSGGARVNNLQPLRYNDLKPKTYRVLKISQDIRAQLPFTTVDKCLIRACAGNGLVSLPAGFCCYFFLTKKSEENCSDCFTHPTSFPFFQAPPLWVIRVWRTQLSQTSSVRCTRISISYEIGFMMTLIIFSYPKQQCPYYSTR